MLGVTAATIIGYEYRAVCWSPRSERSLVLSIAGVTAIMLTAYLILLILY
jgi:hypothetical protein